MSNLTIDITKIDVTSALLKSCETCIKGKYAISFNHDAAGTRYVKYENYMSLDLCGPISKISYKGFKYINTFLNIVTKWLDFRLLRTKNEALEAFKCIKVAIEN